MFLLCSAFVVTVILILFPTSYCQVNYIYPDPSKDAGGGVGSKVQEQWACIIMSRMLSNYQYVHVPLVNLDFEVGADKAENHFGIGLGEINLKDIELSASANVFQCHTFMQSNSNLWGIFQAELRNKYFSSLKPVISEFNKKSVNIAVHYRVCNFMTKKESSSFRGNEPSERCAITYSDVSQQLNHLIVLLKSITTLPLNIQIYSQPSLNTTEFLRHLDGIPVAFNIFSDALYTHTALSTADVLVLARSSFSYTAGILNNGFVMYTPFWLNAPKDWVIDIQNLSFQATSLLSRVIRKVESRSNG